MTVSWPEGKRAAAVFTSDVDAESGVLAHDPAASSRMSLMPHHSYGTGSGGPWTGCGPRRWARSPSTPR